MIKIYLSKNEKNVNAKSCNGKRFVLYYMKNEKS